MANLTVSSAIDTLMQAADAAGARTAIASAPLASPIFTGTPAGPTATSGTNTTQLATTAFVQTAIAGVVTVLAGEVATFASLPAASGLSGKNYLVRQSSGVYFVSRKPAGIYTSDGSVWNFDGDSTEAYFQDTLAWTNITSKPSTFAPSAHASSHASAGSDPITIAESQVTNLTSDLAAKQATLVSATNIKTVNGSSLLGSGDLVVSGGGGLWSDATNVSVTGTTSLTSGAAGKLHVCSGISSNYAVTLPTAASCSGKLIHFMMSGALTKLVTLTGNGAETIDGTNTRVMWANESASLWSDGSAWYKVSGRAIPLSCMLSLMDGGNPFLAQSISNTTMTVINHNTLVDPTGIMGDTSAHTITIIRPGVYNVLAIVSYSADTTWSASRSLNRIYLNGSALTGDENSVITGAWPSFPLPGTFTFAVSDVLDQRTYQNSGSSQWLYGSKFNYLSVTEVPQW